MWVQVASNLGASVTDMQTNVFITEKKKLLSVNVITIPMENSVQNANLSIGWVSGSREVTVKI